MLICHGSSKERRVRRGSWLCQLVWERMARPSHPRANRGTRGGYWATAWLSRRHIGRASDSPSGTPQQGGMSALVVNSSGWGDTTADGLSGSMRHWPKAPACSSSPWVRTTASPGADRTDRATPRRDHRSRADAKHPRSALRNGNASDPRVELFTRVSSYLSAAGGRARHRTGAVHTGGRPRQSRLDRRWRASKRRGRSADRRDDMALSRADGPTRASRDDAEDTAQTYRGVGFGLGSCRVARRRRGYGASSRASRDDDPGSLSDSSVVHSAGAVFARAGRNTRAKSRAAEKPTRGARSPT